MAKTTPTPTPNATPTGTAKPAAPAASGVPGAAGRAAFALCHRLRSKAMYMDVEYDPSVPGGIPGDGYFWCTHTQNCLGPDGRVADRERCVEGAGRACFERAY